MVQFYFLSVLINIIAGLVLVYGVNLASSSSKVIKTTVDDFSGDIDDEDPFAPLDSDAASGENSQTVSDSSVVAGMNSPVFRLIIGILAVFVALMKILSVYAGDIPVVGDLLPALAGVLGGAALLIEYFVSTTSDDSAVPDNVRAIFIDSRKYIGVICIVAGVLHFVFPKVLLL